MPIVLDASVAANWHFQDERNEKADVILASILQETAIVPIQWWFEIRNTLLMGERRGRATEAQTMAFLKTLAGLPIEIDGLPDDEPLVALARKHRLTIYDSAYLELAQRERMPLATFDVRLQVAAHAEGVRVLGE